MAKAVYRLLGVSHDEEGAAARCTGAPICHGIFCRKIEENLCLKGVSILKLVYQEIAVAVVDMANERSTLPCILPKKVTKI